MDLSIIPVEVLAQVLLEQIHLILLMGVLVNIVILQDFFTIGAVAVEALPTVLEMVEMVVPEVAVAGPLEHQQEELV